MTHLPRPGMPQDLGLDRLAELYRLGTCSPAAIVRALYRHPRLTETDPAWIHVRPEAEAVAAAEAVAMRKAAGEELPLYGIPFAVKDNIDVEGMPTTAACPGFSYMPERSATSVEWLIAAGAICLGKTNLDQFATGLNGTRSPYGACASVFNADYASGGSSSGSAIAVAEGLVTFALGTDTGGSGRVPAAFNNLVGLKPTIGLVPTRGLVPNCRTIDCVSVFALSVGDAEAVLGTMAGPDSDDAFSRATPLVPPLLDGWRAGDVFRFGVPRASQRTFFDAPDGERVFDEACTRLRSLGGVEVEADFAPLFEAGAMMFDGYFVAERVAGLRSFMETHEDALLPVIRDIMRSARRFSAIDAFEQLYRLRELKRGADALLRTVDVLVTPTVAAPCRIDALLADPLRLNNRFGHYSYFVNLLDLCSVAVPSGFLKESGVGMGVSITAPAFQDAAVARLAAAFHAETRLKPGVAERARPFGAAA